MTPTGGFFFKTNPLPGTHGDPEPHQQHIDPKIWGAIQSGKHTFQSALLPSQTGYLRVVGMPTGDNTQLAEPILAAICSLQTLGAKHWIVDLRYNGGGNMFPMLAGLSTILGEGEIGVLWTPRGTVFLPGKLKTAMPTTMTCCMQMWKNVALWIVYPK
jgi:hypothetical protein